MMLLSLHLTDLNQCKEIERFLFLFRWVNFQHVLLFVLYLFVANWRLFVEISVAKCCLAMATKMVGAWGAALEPER